MKKYIYIKTNVDVSKAIGYVVWKHSQHDGQTELVQLLKGREWK